MNERRYDPDAPIQLRRRDVVRLLGISAAIAGSGCFGAPHDKVLPYVRQPRELTPGIPNEYATSTVVDGLALGVIAVSREGRPVKIEGNPDHPASRGATRPLDQASVLSLYDPDRAQGVLRRGQPATWEAFVREVSDPEARGGLRFVLPPESSPLVGALLDEIASRHPDARFCFESPIDRSSVDRATTTLFGGPRTIHYDFTRASVIVALDSDFAGPTAPTLKWARDFASRRRVDPPFQDLSRLYAIEPLPSPTGTLADHHFPIRSLDISAFARALLDELLAHLTPSPFSPTLTASISSKRSHAFDGLIHLLAQDLAKHHGQSVVIAGDQQPEETHVLAYLLNLALGNVGATVVVAPSPLLHPRASQSLVELSEEMRAGKVDTLIMLGSNPAYDAPADVDFATLLPHVRSSAHWSLHRNETSEVCEWNLPSNHLLESWGDARAHDGTISFVQPLIAPMYDGRSLCSVLAPFAGRDQTNDYTLLRTHWQKAWGGDFEAMWNASIQRGFALDTAFTLSAPDIDSAAVERSLANPSDSPAGAIELHFEVSPQVVDGRFANSGWLQELPHPLTKMTWGNAAIMSPARAASLTVETGSRVRITAGSTYIDAPVYVLPGHAEDSVSIALGYGRRGKERLASVGVDAYPMRRAGSLHATAGVTLTKLDGSSELAITQDFGDMAGAEIALHQTVSEYREHPAFAASHRAAGPSLLPAVAIAPGPQWAMTIDTSICTGCSSCVVACQAENNIAVAGFDAVRRGREMHWLRIDRYFTGPSHSTVVNQPMLCQHCEKAPCEYVCPVNATVHSPDGLNEMVYNRCVGTRFCSNNCPYKVRRFNWLEPHLEEPLSLQLSPDVTVRARGVMEKCSYCVQRIRRAEIAARKEARPIAAGEVITACAQACPTGAITFGDLNHSDTPMVRNRNEPRVYQALSELGTRPRTQYLTKISNPNPDIT